MATGVRIIRKLLCSSVATSFLTGFPIGESEKKIFLTFDDGPVPSHTANLLELLDEFNAKATFFVVGQQLEKNYMLGEKIVAAGHLLANHTHSHPPSSIISEEEIYQCQEIIDSLQKDKRKYFRAPRGEIALPLLSFLMKSEFIPALWDVDSKDSHGFTASEIFTFLKDIRNRSVVLFHDDNALCLNALKFLFPYWQEAGFSFETLISN